jgi:hypothetical protein
MKFEFNDVITQELVDLLAQTTLGTNGAMYRHLDVPERIYQTDAPLSFSLRRNEHLLANITFCKRDFGLYLRYFAFDKRFQSTGKARQTMHKSALKQEIEGVFQRVSSEYPGSLDMCYAYIDARNDRSKWMSEQFGFQTKAKLATQSFSRRFPKKSSRISKEVLTDEHLSLIKSKYGHYTAFFDHYLEQGVLHCLRSSDGNLLAVAKFTNVTWEISRLPGKMGGILVKCLPFIPIVRKMVQVKKHQFLVPEAVCVSESDPRLLTEFLAGVLYMEKRHTMLWWMDERDELYVQVKKQLNWGILHLILGVSLVDVVIRGAFEPKEPMYIAAFDMI